MIHRNDWGLIVAVYTDKHIYTIVFACALFVYSMVFFVMNGNTNNSHMTYNFSKEIQNDELIRSLHIQSKFFSLPTSPLGFLVYLVENR